MIAATVFEVLLDALLFVRTALHSHRQLAAENLFLRKELALYIQRQTKPRRATDGTRLTLVMLAGFIDWRPVLTIVQPDTLVRWHRRTFRLLWRWKSRPVGRPPIPTDVQQLIAEMARANRTWGEERIAGELLLKLGVSLSPLTARRYMVVRLRPIQDCGPKVWRTFVRTDARGVLACDFFVTVTARFRIDYALLCLYGGTCCLVHERDCASNCRMDRAAVCTCDGREYPPRTVPELLTNDTATRLNGSSARESRPRAGADERAVHPLSGLDDSSKRLIPEPLVIPLAVIVRRGTPQALVADAGLPAARSGSRHSPRSDRTNRSANALQLGAHAGVRTMRTPDVSSSCSAP